MAGKETCQNLQSNKQQCTCTCSCSGCTRHGACCQCIAYHRQNGDLPSCLR